MTEDDVEQRDAVFVEADHRHFINRASNVLYSP